MELLYLEMISGFRIGNLYPAGLTGPHSCLHTQPSSQGGMLARLHRRRGGRREQVLTSLLRLTACLLTTQEGEVECGEVGEEVEVGGQKYRLEAELGRGGFSRVFRTQKAGTTVAIKVNRP